MTYFNCDYLEGAHPRIMEALMRSNMEQSIGYGEDAHCLHAAHLIKQKCHTPHADVHFLIGGTGANTTVIASILRPYEGVLSADTGHINQHETGAIESSGHKVLALTSADGKITAQQVCQAVHLQADDEHTVKPGMIYISQPTELGTLYSKAELTALSKAAAALSLPLFIDGARMGYGLMAKENDLTLCDIAALCDVFTIGGTKVGALFGEAVVITNPAYQSHFRYIMKQRGGMLAKGRLLGIQFETLMQDHLYESIASTAIEQAVQLRQTLKAKHIPLLIDSPTNQLFPIFDNDSLAKLSEKYTFATWAKVDDSHTAVRICTSWASTAQSVAALIDDLQAL